MAFFHIGDMKKILIIVLILLISFLFLYGNLLKGSAGTDYSPLSLANITKVTVFFMICVLVYVCYKKIMKRH